MTQLRVRQMIVRILTLTVLCSLGLLRDASAQVPVEIAQLDGTRVSGRLTSISAENIRLENGGPMTIADVLSLRVTDLPTGSTPPINASGWTVLATGDQLRLVPLAIDDVSILTKWARFPTLPAVEIPLEVCRGMALKLPASPIGQGHIFSRVLQRSEESDQVVLRNGDRISGTFVGLADGRILIETSAGEVPVDVRRSQSLTFDPGLVSTPDLPGQFASLSLADGSTLWASNLRSDGEELLVEALAGFELALPVTILREIQFYSPRSVSLAALTVLRQESTPFLTTSRKPRIGRNVLGGPLSVSGRRFATGIGVSSGTLLTWQLDGSASQFIAVVGIDDAAGGQGSVIFDVLLDGEPVWTSQRLTGRDAAVDVPAIHLTDANELTLRTRFADRGHVFDFANWGNPRLVLRE